MQAEERLKLKAAATEKEYMSIAINQDGSPVRGCFIPWEKTVSAFNMKTPQVTISVDDLQNEEIMQEISSCKMKGCYILTPLSDYSFLSAYHEICDIFIRYAENMKDLSFIKDMPELFMFYLENARLHDIAPLITNCNKGALLPGKCFGFYHCEIEDVSAMKEAGFIISELLIWVKSGQSDNKERWLTDRHIGEFRLYSEAE